MKESIFIEKLKSDNQEGFVAIYHLLYDPLLFFICRYVKKIEVAEEILTDVFVNVWNRRMDFHTMEHLRAFLYISAKNASLNSVRSEKNRPYLEPITKYQDMLSIDVDTFSSMIHTELIQSIFEEVERLPKRQREVFNLTYLEDKTVDEIAQQLEMSISAVYANRSRAIHTLRLSLKAKSDILLLIFATLFKV